MKSFETDLKKYADKIRLKTAERHELRERILSYMEYHPLPKQSESISAGSISSQQFVMVHFNTVWSRVAAGAFALLLVIGVPFAAERAVPGDVLYLVKTGVNESIQSQFANSPYEKVVFETKLMERRISEARLLASEGKLTKEVEEEIAKTVQVHADAAQSGLAELRTDNADEAAIAEIAFGSALEVQSAVLDTNKSESATSSIENILGVVNTTREEIELNRGTTTPSYDGLSARVELETTRAYELFKAIKESATYGEELDITRRLEDINRQILEAKDLRTEDEAVAITELMEALGLTQKLIAFMTDIDVRETVALETLVPIVPTQEERIASVNASLVRTAGITKDVTDRIPYVADEKLLEKLVLGIEQISEFVSVATSSLAANEIEQAEKSSAEAEILAQDLEKMTSGTSVDETTGEISEGGTVTETGTSTDAIGDAVLEENDLNKDDTVETVDPVIPVDVVN